MAVGDLLLYWNYRGVSSSNYFYTVLAQVFLIQSFVNIRKIVLFSFFPFLATVYLE